MRKHLLPPDRNWYRANFHCHSHLSDGYWPPARLRDALVSHIAHLLAYHDERAETLDQDLALQRLFVSYSTIMGISPHLHPRLPATTTTSTDMESIGYAVGSFNDSNANRGEAASLFYAMMNDSLYALDL